MSAEEPTLADVEAAITIHGRHAHRGGRAWPAYVWTHEEINRLLDERDRVLNQMCTEALARNTRRVGLRRILGT